MIWVNLWLLLIAGILAAGWYLLRERCVAIEPTALRFIAIAVYCIAAVFAALLMSTFGIKILT